MTVRLYENLKKVCDKYQRLSICREWFGGDAIKLASSDLIVASKTCEFDCQDTPCHPDFRKLAISRANVWGISEFYGENAGWISWSSPAYFDKIFDELELFNLDGLILHHNPDMEFMGYPSKVQQLNLLQASAKINGRNFYQEEFLISLFGAGNAMLAIKILAVNAKIILNIGKMIHSRGEGHTYTAYYPFSAENGTIESSFFQKRVCEESTNRGLSCSPKWLVPWYADFFRPDDWIAGDLIKIQDYMDFYQSHEWNDDYHHNFTTHGKSPILLLRSFASEWEKLKPHALKTLKQLHQDRSAELEYEWNIILRSAQTAEAMVEEFTNFAEAEIYKAAWMNQNNQPAILEKLKRLACQSLQKVIKAMEYQLETSLRYPDQTINFPRDIQGSNRGNLEFHSLADRLEWRRAELNQFDQYPNLVK